MHDNLDADVLRRLHELFLQCNPWVRRYAYAACNALQINWKWDGPEEMNDAMVIGSLIAEYGSHRDIRLCQTSGEIVFINDSHCLFHPLAYPLLFPSGQVGWHWGMKNNHGQRLSLSSYMKYMLMHRHQPTHIQRCGKLALEYYCDAWATIESQKCDFHRLPSQQRLYRSCSRAALIDQLQHADAADIGVPVRTILPSSYVGGPRYYHRLFQNAMALPRRFGRPDLFITMTCNPAWSEITLALPAGSSWAEHPDIVARVFMIKVACLFDDIRNKQIFGPVAAIVYRIEWQSRGLPHMHMLVILESHINSVADIDNIVSAEVPDPDEHPMLHELVRQFHIHKPCDNCGDAGCRKKSADGSCFRSFPKKMTQTTNQPIDGFPIYRKRGRFTTNVKDHNGVDRVVTDEWVVPFVPFLLLRYKCHLNVEIACHLFVFKYVYKYVFKAPDKAAVAVDEISAYLEGRLLTASEAVFRILGLSLHCEWPPVMAMDIHLPMHERVVFDPEMDREELWQLSRDPPSRTMLTAWFYLNETDAAARQFLYHEIPEHYSWDAPSRSWSKRTLRCIAVGRIHSVSVANVELFALRQLLDIVRGCISFRDLLHVNGVIHTTFVQACIARGLRDCDDAIMCTLQEMFASTASEEQCREYFAQVLLHCNVVNANQLFDALSHDLYDDQTSSAQHALAHIDSLLRASHRSIADYGFDAVIADFANLHINISDRDMESNRNLAAELSQLCTEEQSASLQSVMNSLQSRGTRANVFVVSGPAGTGKTLWTNALTSTLRSMDIQVLCVASSALAASLMLNGRTAHSALHIPIPAHEDCFCAWDARTKRELRKISVLIWDEMSMINRNVANVVDASFQDLHGNNLPFGGITVVFVGDFQQLPPVVPKGKGEHTTMHRCDWYKRASVAKFTRNWRAVGNAQYAAWLERIGNGSEVNVQLPAHCLSDTVNNLIFRVYGNADNIVADHDGKMILSLTVADARIINELVINMIPGPMDVAVANDAIPVQDSVPPEYVSSMTISGVPEFRLAMKLGARYMILKNYSPGICNGVLCVLKSFSRYTVQVQLLTGPRKRSIVLLPRVTFNISASTSGLPFDFVRTQFPITLAYCVTVHKAQGQTLQRVGLYFSGETFAHGQLYVALSRVGGWEHIVANKTEFVNIVFKFLVQ
jgi:DNA replication protein DnaC